MALGAAFQVGRSALAASQLAIQVAGDNLANVATPGFNRRVATFAPVPGAGGALGVSAGGGVSLADISRRVDQSLLTRLRASVSDFQAASVASDLNAQVESITNDLGEYGLSAQLNQFTNAFSELANNPSGSEIKSLIVEQGGSLASYLRGLRSDLVNLRNQVDQQLRSAVNRADELLGDIARLNVSISTSELGSAENVALRDQRDALLEELSGLVDISTIPQNNGSVDVRIGSTPVVQNGTVRGLQLKLQTENGELTAKVIVPGQLEERVFPESGRIGGLLAQRGGLVEQTIADLDTLTSSLIFEVNRIHSSGRSFPGLTSTISERTAGVAFHALALNDPANTPFATLPFAAGNGSFEVVVTEKSTGITHKVAIEIDLDGIDNTGAPGFADDTSLADIQAALNAVPNLNATLGTDGRISISADAGFEFGFAGDSSGALAVLGINTFFTGTTARDIGVRQQLLENPQFLVAGAEQGSNEAALAIIALQEKSVGALGGASITEAWRRVTERTAVNASSANTRAQAEGQVRASLEAQRAAVSGVSIDEESINLLTFQRQYQAAAQYISTVDELMELLISLV